LALYEASVALEREVWSRIDGRTPCHPDHDPELWEQWLFCVRATAHAAKVLDEAHYMTAKWWTTGSTPAIFEDSEPQH